MFFVKIMSAEDLPDDDPRKSYELFEAHHFRLCRDSGQLVVRITEQRPVRVGDIETLEDYELASVILRGNMYVMNDRGRTVASASPNSLPAWAKDIDSETRGLIADGAVPRQSGSGEHRLSLISARHTVGRIWTHEHNKGKVLDPQLAEDMAKVLSNYVTHGIDITLQPDPPRSPKPPGPPDPPGPVPRKVA